MLPTNFISDLEKAIAERSTETGAMLHKITDLFLLNAGHYSADQINLYDDVLQRLISKVDAAARATLAQRIAGVEQTPKDTIRSLALDEAIEVAEPILTNSNALDDGLLVECITKHGQKHLLAIATRNSISETVSSHLIRRGDRNVLGAVVNNPGARISDTSFEVLIDKSAADEWLSECIGRRSDIPDHHFRQLVTRASETVRRRLIGDDPQQQQLINSILPPTQQQVANPKELKDYRTAELAVKLQRPITEAVVKGFAEGKKPDEMIVAIAELSGLSVYEIEGLFMGRWSSLVAIILKAIGFHLSTLQAIYGARLPHEAASELDLVRTKAEFIGLRRQTAERILRFYQVRKTADFSVPQSQSMRSAGP